MPICFKCGKNLATDQSLQYHLQKRVKCNTLICPLCKKQFPNKLLFDNHKHECNYKANTVSKYDIFDQIQTNNIYIIEVNNSYTIDYISKNFDFEKNDVIGKDINSLFNYNFNFDEFFNNIEIEHDNKNLDMNIKYNKDEILIIGTQINV